MEKLLNNLDNADNIKNIFNHMWTIPGLASSIISIVLAIIVFKFLTAISRRLIKHTIRNILIAACIYFTVFTSGLKLIDIINLENREKAIIENIIDTANKQNIELEITDTHIIYNGKSYKHHIPNIDEYIYRDKNNNYVITE
jgi:K+ transporter